MVIRIYFFKERFMKAIELEKAYNPKDFEDRIYSQWEQNKSFKPDSDKNPEKSGAK